MARDKRSKSTPLKYQEPLVPAQDLSQCIHISHDLMGKSNVICIDDHS